MAKQSPLSALARDHNWRMGKLLRDRSNISDWRSNAARVAGLNALDLEIRLERETYVEDHRLLRQQMADDRARGS